MMDVDYLIKIIRGVIMVPHLQTSVARAVKRFNVNDYSLLLFSPSLYLSLSLFLLAFQLRGLS